MNVAPLLLLTNTVQLLNVLVQTRAIAGTCEPAWGLQSVRSLLLMQQPAECEVHRYHGGMYGVSAAVALDLRKRQAHVQLRGIPLGGRVEGVGRLASDDQEAGPVELEEELAAALGRRLVSIVRAHRDRATDTLTVVVSVPLLGEQTLVLTRVHEEEEESVE